MVIRATTEFVAETYRAHKRAAWALIDTDKAWAAEHFRVALDLCELLIIRTRDRWDVASVYEAERKGLAFCLGELKKGLGNGTICEDLLPPNYRR